MNITCSDEDVACKVSFSKVSITLGLNARGLETTEQRRDLFGLRVKVPPVTTYRLRGTLTTIDHALVKQWKFVKRLK